MSNVRKMAHWSAPLSKLAHWLTNEDSFSNYLYPIASIFRPETHPDLIPAKVISLVWQNKNIYTLTLKPKRSQFRNFLAGQFVLLETEVNGRRLQRSFSISSEPAAYERHGIIQLSIRVQEHGKVTPWLCRNAVEGSYLHISQAQGAFTDSKRIAPKLYIAAGSGITPVLSMLLQAHDKHDQNQSSLLYFVRDSSDTGFGSEFNRLREQGVDIRIFSTPESGYFTEQHLQSLPHKAECYEAYICGPGTMIESCKNVLTRSGIDEQDIYFEYFGFPFTHTLQETGDTSSVEGHAISFKRSGRQVHCQKNDNRTLLQIAENEALSPLSGCRIGVCHQCACKKISGRIKNLRTNTISDSGPEEIQLCISQPVEDVALEI